MKKLLLLTIAFIFILSIPIYAQNPVFGQEKRTGGMQEYRRNSCYSILIQHPEQKFSTQIQNVYYQRPQLEKFNDHSLSVLAITTSGTLPINEIRIREFLEKNEIANRLVAKWFNRDRVTGACDMELIKERGGQDASTAAEVAAELLQRQNVFLQDAGIELIDHTFVLVHDITYVRKENKYRGGAIALRVFGFLVQGALTAYSASQNDASYAAVGGLLNLGAQAAAGAVDEIDAFQVKVTTHLYRLEWSEEMLMDFFTKYYMEANSIDINKKLAWKNANYKLLYLGSETTISEDDFTERQQQPEDVIKKTIYRAIDKCNVMLQRKYEDFKIKEPIFAYDGKFIKACIGTREGVSEKSCYEILEKFVDGKGRTQYRKVGKAIPVPALIWDNRYMALEDGCDNSELKATTFRVKGTNGSIYPGMLIREIKF